MGYETEIYLVTSHEPRLDGEPAFCLEVARVDLCKTGRGTPVSDVIAASHQRSRENGWKPYVDYSDDDGDKPAWEDCYGEPLGVVGVDHFLAALVASNKEDPYRRFDIAIAMLEAAKGKFSSGLCILTRGH